MVEISAVEAKHEVSEKREFENPDKSVFKGVSGIFDYQVFEARFKKSGFSMEQSLPV